jgi:hypothetical protein
MFDGMNIGNMKQTLLVFNDNGQKPRNLCTDNNDYQRKKMNINTAE